MVMDQAVSAHVERLVEGLAPAADDGAGHLARACLKAWIEAAVGGKGLRIPKTSRRDDVGKPDDGGELADLRRGGKYADHLVPWKGPGVGFPIHGAGFLEDPGFEFLSLGSEAVVLFVLGTEDEADFHGDREGAEVPGAGRLVGYAVLHDGAYPRILHDAPVPPHGQPEAGDDVVDAVPGGSGVMDAAFAFRDEHAECPYILARYVALTPDVDLVV